MSVLDIINKRIEEENVKSAEQMAKKAKYKIQIWFKSDRSIHKPIAFSLSAWQSGKRLHGGGDEMMFICKKIQDAQPSRSLTGAVNGCGKFIPGDLNEGLVVCPHCFRKWERGEIGDSVFYRLPVESAVTVIADWFRRLENNADIYAKYRPNDPRTLLMAKSMSPQAAKEKKGLTIYPLENIIQDTLTGSTLESRIRAFITA